MQKGFQRGGRFGRAVCRCILWDIDPTQRQPVFVRAPALQRHVGQRVRRCLIHCGTPASHRWRDAKGIPFVASRLFSLERVRPVTGRTQRGIARDAIRVETHEHTAVIRQAFVQYPSGYAVADHIQADTTASQIQLHPVFFPRRRRKDKRFPPCAFGRRHISWWLLLQQVLHRVCKGNALHTDKVVKRAFPADVPAFPVPQAGALADFKAVVAAQLVFARTTAHQFFRSVPLQELYRRHLLCPPELFLFKVRHHNTASRSACTLFSRSHGNSARPKWP